MTGVCVDLGRLVGNYRYARALAQGRELMCVVKANAYGHGIARVTRALYAEGCRLFASATLCEALAVRRCAPEARVLVLGDTPPRDAAILHAHRIAQCVHSLSYAAALSAAAYAPVSVHWKLDTGMHRLGFSCEAEGLDALLRAAALPHLQSEGLFTHAADAAHRVGVKTARQHADFLRAYSYLCAKGLSVCYVHTQNSAALVNHSFCEGNASRAGILLYGYGTPDVRPVLSWESRVVASHRVKKGESVGYFPPYRPPRDTNVFVLPVGYADGYARAYCGAQVEVGDRRATVVAVCMDMLLVESEYPVPDGTAARLLWDGYDAQALAQQGNTIPYEVLCRIGWRQTRRYRSEKNVTLP